MYTSTAGEKRDSSVCYFPHREHHLWLLAVTKEHNFNQTNIMRLNWLECGQNLQELPKSSKSFQKLHWRQ